MMRSPGGRNSQPDNDIRITALEQREAEAKVWRDFLTGKLVGIQEDQHALAGQLATLRDELTSTAKGAEVSALMNLIVALQTQLKTRDEQQARAAMRESQSNLVQDDRLTRLEEAMAMGAVAAAKAENAATKTECAAPVIVAAGDRIDETAERLSKLAKTMPSIPPKSAGLRGWFTMILVVVLALAEAIRTVKGWL